MPKEILKTIAYVAFALMFFICALIAAHWAISFASWSTLDSGWAQFIGAMLGISIAIEVARRQYLNGVRAELERKHDEQRRVCMAFRDELISLQKAFSGFNVTHLLAVPVGGIFNLRIPIPIDRFPIYRAMIGRLTLIDDDAIRQGIIDAYGCANATMEAGFLNNSLLQEYTTLARIRNAEANQFNIDEFDFAVKRLEQSCIQMQNIAKRTMVEVENVLPLLDAAIQRGHRELT